MNNAAEGIESEIARIEGALPNLPTRAYPHHPSQPPGAQSVESLVPALLLRRAACGLSRSSLAFALPLSHPRRNEPLAVGSIPRSPDSFTPYPLTVSAYPRPYYPSVLSVPADVEALNREWIFQAAASDEVEKLLRVAPGAEGAVQGS